MAMNGQCRLLPCALLLAGCATVPNLGSQPKPRVATSFEADRTFAAYRQAGAASEGWWPDGAWWRGYRDPQLVALIEEAMAGTPDIAIAVARRDRAEAYRRQAGAALLPRLDANGQVLEQKQSYNNGIPAAFVPQGWNDTGSASLNLTFDPDLWGKNRATLRAATSDAEAAAFDVAQARLLLSTDIAGAYADLARLFAERDVEERALTLRLDTRKLVADRVATGLDTRAELKQADAAIPAQRATLAQIDESIALTRNRLAALLGEGPDRGVTIGRPALTVDARAIPADVTTDLIGRRPDIASARARVETRAAQIRATRADFYPSISLNGLIGFQSLGLSNLFKSGSYYGQAGPAVSLPIFHGGELAGRYRAARADYDEAVATYDGTVAAAFHEVADAVTSQSLLDIRLGHSRQALADAQEAYSIARQRYQGGLANYLTVLTAQDGALQQERAVTSLEARRMALDIALVRALGGGAVPAVKSSGAVGAASR